MWTPGGTKCEKQVSNGEGPVRRDGLTGGTIATVHQVVQVVRTPQTLLVVELMSV